jgi:hypothetical protein
MPGSPRGAQAVANAKKATPIKQAVHARDALINTTNPSPDCNFQNIKLKRFT